MYIALRVSGPKISDRFVRHLDCLIQNDSYVYTYVTAMKLNNWDVLTSEKEVETRLKHAMFTVNSFHLPPSMLCDN